MSNNSILVDNFFINTLIGVVLLILAIALGITAGGKDFANVLVTLFTGLDLPASWRIYMGTLSVILFVVVMKRAW